jgi:hypothetical protein
MIQLAIDPNVCIAAQACHPHSKGLLDDIFENRDYVRIVMDDGEHKVRETFEEVHSKVSDRYRAWVSWLLEGHQIIESPVTKIHSEHQLGESMQCFSSLETQLLGICGEYGIPLVVVGEEYKHPDLFHRNIYDVDKMNRLKHYKPFQHLMVWDARYARRAIADWVKHKPVFPHTEQELRLFLQQNKREGDQLEFKQPYNGTPQSGSRLTRSILIDSMRGICAFANSHGGKVLVGIAEFKNKEYVVGKVEGFEPIYVNKTKQKTDKPNRKTSEEILGIIANDPDFLPGFQPPLTPDQLRCNTVELQSGRMVMVFDVDKPNNKAMPPVTFRGKRYMRFGQHTKSF